jgi:hypothetical protein
MPTILALLVILVMSFATGLADAKEKPATKEAKVAKEKGIAKDSAKASKGPLINSAKAIGFIRERLETSTGIKGWHVELKESTPSGKDFVATHADRTERGSINMRVDYPNEGALRVYLIPRD